MHQTKENGRALSEADTSIGDNNASEADDELAHDSHGSSDTDGVDQNYTIGIARAVKATIVETPVAFNITPRGNSTISHMDVQLSASARTGRYANIHTGYGPNDEDGGFDSGIDTDSGNIGSGDLTCARRPAECQATRRTHLVRVRREVRLRRRDRGDTSMSHGATATPCHHHHRLHDSDSSTSVTSGVSGLNTTSSVSSTSGPGSASDQAREPRGPGTDSGRAVGPSMFLATSVKAIANRLHALELALHAAMACDRGAHPDLHSYMRSERLAPQLVHVQSLLPPRADGTTPITVFDVLNDASALYQHTLGEAADLAARFAACGGQPSDVSWAAPSHG